MTDAKEQLIELRQFLGSEKAYVDSVWAMRVSAATPVPKPFTRSWRWSRSKVVSLAAYRTKSDAELEAAGSGGLR